MLLENTSQTTGHWLRVKLTQPEINKFAIGAIVSVRIGEILRRKQVGVDGSYLSQHQIDVQFGLGDAEVVDELTVLWPNGLMTTRRNVPVDQTITVTP